MPPGRTRGLGVWLQAAFDRFPTAGQKALAPSLDTIGLIGRSLDRIARISGVLAGEPAPAIAAHAPGFALCRTPYAAEAEPQPRDRLASVARRLADAGAMCASLSPAAFAELNELHRVIMANENVRSMAHEWRTARKRHPGRAVSEILLVDRKHLQAVVAGLQVPEPGTLGDGQGRADDQCDDGFASWAPSHGS